jgi:WASH complex subunit strumpellin
MNVADDFLSPNNICGITLLKLVSRGNAIIAELLRLSENVPEVFSNPGQYAGILHGFEYLQHAEELEAVIEASADLVDLDEDFATNHLPLLERFFALFLSVYRYRKDLDRYLADLEEGVFIQHTFEGVLFQTDGKQLLTEALYVYGVILLLMDRRIEGVVRERMLVAYIRYKGESDILHVDQVCRLCRRTGYLPPSAAHPEGKRPADYPEDYFARFGFEEDVVEMVIGRLRSDDLYLQLPGYPDPSHRSTALATQAGMLYVILFFAPEILAEEPAIMREVVDKHFNDNWVISFHMGEVVDLSREWAPYPAARAALNNTLEAGNIRSVQAKHVKKVEPLLERITGLLDEGVLTPEYAVDHVSRLLKVQRDANVTIRWLVLHTQTAGKKLREVVLNGVDQTRVLLLLLNVAQYEFRLKRIFKDLLDTKETRWDSFKAQACERVTELSEYFSGEKALTRVTKDEQLQAWFADIATKIQSLDYHDSTLAGRKIQQLSHALEEVESFHQIETNVHVKHFLGETRSFMQQMVRTVNCKEEILMVITLVSDISYARDVIAGYVDLMQERIKRDPSSTIMLRSLFLKLATVLELPCVRINQAESPDLVSVMAYYSGNLVAFVRDVLQVVPVSMFQILDRVIDVQINSLRELPTRLPRLEMREWAQLEERHVLAAATHRIAKFTEGILAMDTTFVGIIKVDPKQLLEDGIRRELVRQISSAMDIVLQFGKDAAPLTAGLDGGGHGGGGGGGSKSSSSSSSSSSSTDKRDRSAAVISGGSVRARPFEARLAELARRLDGYRRSFEYLQDYVGLYGARIWQEEFSRIVNYNVEQECNDFLTKKVYDWNSSYQSEAIPIPRFPRTDNVSITFMGRLAREMLMQTDSRRVIYVDQLASWIDTAGEEVVGLRTIGAIHRSVGTFGLTGIDRLFSFMTVRDLRSFCRMWKREVDGNMRAFLADFGEELSPLSTIPFNMARSFPRALNACAKLWPLFILDTVTRVGQTQLLRQAVGNELAFSCKLDSNVYYNALGTTNRAVLADVRAHYRSPDTAPYPPDGNPLLPELSRYLDNAGMGASLEKIYITSEPLDGLPLVLFLFVLAQMPRMTFDPRLGTLRRDGKGGGSGSGSSGSSKKAAKAAAAAGGVPTGGDPLDGAPLVAGVVTILKQFHSDETLRFLAHCGQYIRGSINFHFSRDTGTELPRETKNLLHFLGMYCRLSKTPRSAVEAYVPAYLFDQ